jgi:hypothetical protein
LQAGQCCSPNGKQSQRKLIVYAAFSRFKLRTDIPWDSANDTHQPDNILPVLMAIHWNYTCHFYTGYDGSRYRNITIPLTFPKNAQKPREAARFPELSFVSKLLHHYSRVSNRNTESKYCF